MMCLPYFCMASPLLRVDHGAAATAVQKKSLPCCRRLRRLRRHRHHRHRCCFCCAAAAAAAAAAAVLLLSCCCAAAVVTYGYLFSVFLKKYDAVIRNFSRSFLFSIRDLFFCDLMEFRRFDHREHSQSDAGMNLAFYKFDRINWLNCLYRKH